MPEPQIGVAYEFSLALIDTATGGLRVNPTLATGDVKVSKDHGAFANVTTLPTVSPAAGVDVRVQLSGTEMTVTGQTDLHFKDPDGEWEEVFVTLQPVTHLGADNKVLLSTSAQTGVILPRVTLTDTVTTYTGNTPQTGDSFARLGANGAGLTAIPTIATVTTVAAVTTVNGLAANVVTAASLAADAVAELADGVWDEALADHLAGGSAGAALNGAGSAGDPWTTTIPGAYGAGTAGKIVGDNLNATVGSRATQASVDTIDDMLDTEIPAIQASLATIIGLIDTEIAAIKAKTDLIPASPAAVGSAMMLSTDALTAATVALSGAQKLADVLLRRRTASIEASSDGEALHINSLYGALAIGTGHLRDTTTHSDMLTVYRANGTTELAQIPLVTDNLAEPIVSAGS